MRVVNSVAIHATPEEVFYWIGDPDHAMKWMTSVTRSEVIEATPDMVGTTFREYIEENGRGTEMRGTVTEFVPNEVFAVRLEGEYNSVEARFVLERRGDMTQLTQDAVVRFHGILKIVGLLQAPSFKKKIASQASEEFAKLKQLCEQDS